MRRNRAFTLIELLVVIAIIAILAAILFPVFAQAKQAAKGAASISNAKQIGTASIMYSGDYDDMLVIVANWGGSGAPVAYGGINYSPWPWLVQPYMKNLDILHDPQAPTHEAWPTSWGFPATTAKAIEPSYGYNHANLSPISWATSPFAYQTKSQTNATDVANTVMFANKFATTEDNQGPSSIYGYFGYNSPTPTSSIIVEGPADYSTMFIPKTTLVFDNWGQSTFWATYLNNKEQPGAFTGGASIRGPKQMVVLWLDSHASKKSAGAMAAGTNWNPTIAGSAVVINDPSKYLWSLEK